MVLCLFADVNHYQRKEKLVGVTLTVKRSEFSLQYRCSVQQRLLFEERRCGSCRFGTSLQYCCLLFSFQVSPERGRLCTVSPAYWRFGEQMVRLHTSFVQPLLRSLTTQKRLYALSSSRNAHQQATLVLPLLYGILKKGTS
jgi:hypothetical protein